MAVHIHPSAEGGVKPGAASFAGGALKYKCADRPVRVKVASQVVHKHACGCTKRWKLHDAIFSVVAVVPREPITVLDNGDKLKIVDEGAAGQRHACTA